MAYTPPVGTADLDLTGSYTPPVGTVNLDLGATAVPERTAALAGETLAPVGAVAILSGRVAVLSGETLAPTGLIQARRVLRVTLAGETLAPTGRLDAAWDPNLLSAVHVATGAIWEEGENTAQRLQDALESAPALQVGIHPLWQAAPLLTREQRPLWQPTPPLTREGLGRWNEAVGLSAPGDESWRSSPRLEQGIAGRWQAAADPMTMPVIIPFLSRTPRLTPGARSVWSSGTPLSRHWYDGIQDGLRLEVVTVELWQWAGIPGNAPNPGPPLPPPPIRPGWGTSLNLRCPLPGTALRIGRTPCILIAEREIPLRRTYMSTNSASLVRLPDLTPLPVTAMTVETDFDSWCWALTATLAGPEAWALVQPNPLACEVLATINGQDWKFLLDVPSTSRSFNADRVTLKGRSRSAWLHGPYTLSSDRSEVNARDMTQLAEAALVNTGWTLDWQLPDWTVPAGRYVSHNTPIGVLIRLVNTTDDGLYTDPTLQILTARRRWPVASWLLDGQTTDLLIPESAVISLTQAPVYSPPYNGVYVAGTSHGALALVKIAGTDGALQPAEPLVNELLCDEAGVAARQRGINLLSDSGAGWEMDAEVLFTPEVGLVRPGLIVSIAGVKGISRSCRIAAQWSNGLSVRQSVGLERREVENA